jgi:hypothetical protein
MIHIYGLFDADLALPENQFPVVSLTFLLITYIFGCVQLTMFMLYINNHKIVLNISMFASLCFLFIWVLDYNGWYIMFQSWVTWNLMVQNFQNRLLVTFSSFSRFETCKWRMSWEQLNLFTLERIKLLPNIIILALDWFSSFKTAHVFHILILTEGPQIVQIV